MSRKASIYKGDTLLKLEQDLLSHCDDKITRVVNTICDRYSEMIAHYTPALTENEWLALCDVLNGYMTDDIKQAARGLHWSLSDGISMDGLGEKWDIDATFCEYIKDAEFAEKIAIIHVCQVFWSLKAGEGEEFRSLLERAGAKIS